jgi:hypothetical protein
MKNKLTNHIKTKIGKWQVIHSPKRNFIWYKNAKTAGTSMYRGIMIEEIDDLISYKEQPKEFDLWWNSLTDEKINDCFTFTFVRNPFDRLVSAFMHIIIEDLSRNTEDLMDRLRGTATQFPRPNTFKDIAFMTFYLFVKRCLKFYNLNDESVHWMPQHFFAKCDGKDMVDFIGKYENLEADWKYVANKLQISEDLPFEPASYAAKGAMSLHGHPAPTREIIQHIHFSEFYYNDTILEIVYDVYKEDIDLFDYKFSGPEKM